MGAARAPPVGCEYALYGTLVQAGVAASGQPLG